MLALLVEGLLVLIVMTFGSSIYRGDEKGTTVNLVRFRASTERQQAQKPREDEASDSQKIVRPRAAKAEPAKSEPVESPIAPRPTPPIPRLIPLSPTQMASANISPAAKAPSAAIAVSRPKMGPPDVGSPSDSARVSGSGPNGEPLYAAAWYREPYEDELSGYLSTATGPGWGLIACRTASDYRVEDCVKVDEYPNGSNIARSVLAAAWQFRVRPPRVGGQPRIGEWVRIRIDYGVRRR